MINNKDSLAPSNALLLAEEIVQLPAKWKGVISSGLRKINALRVAEKQARLGDAPVEPMLVAAENNRQKDLNLSVFDHTSDFLQYLLDLETEVKDDSVIHRRAMVGVLDGYHYGAFDIRVEKKKNEKPTVTVIAICSIGGFEIKSDLEKYLENFPIDVAVKIIATKVMASPTGCRIFAKSFASKMLKHSNKMLGLHRQIAGEIGIQTAVAGTDLLLPLDFYKHTQRSVILKSINGFDVLRIGKKQKETLSSRDIRFRFNRLTSDGNREINTSSEGRRKLDYERSDKLLDTLPPDSKGAATLVDLLNAAAPSRKIGWDDNFPQTKALIGMRWDARQGLKPLVDDIENKKNWLNDGAENLVAVATELIEALPTLHWPSLQKDALASLLYLVNRIAQDWPDQLAPVLEKVPVDFFAKVLSAPLNVAQYELIPDAYKIYEKKFEQSSEPDRQRLRKETPAQLALNVDEYEALINKTQQKWETLKPEQQFEELKTLDKADLLRIFLRRQSIDTQALWDSQKSLERLLLLNMLPEKESEKLWDAQSSNDKAALWDDLKAQPYQQYNLLTYLPKRQRDELWQSRLLDDHDVLWEKLARYPERIPLLKILSQKDREIFLNRRAFSEFHTMWNEIKTSAMKLSLLENLSPSKRSELWRINPQDHLPIWGNIEPQQKIRLLEVLPSDERNALWGKITSEDRKELWSDIPFEDGIHLLSLLSADHQNNFWNHFEPDELSDMMLGLNANGWDLLEQNVSSKLYADLKNKSGIEQNPVFLQKWQSIVDLRIEHQVGVLNTWQDRLKNLPALAYEQDQQYADTLNQITKAIDKLMLNRHQQSLLDAQTLKSIESTLNKLIHVHASTAQTIAQIESREPKARERLCTTIMNKQATHERKYEKQHMRFNAAFSALQSLKPRTESSQRRLQTVHTYLAEQAAFLTLPDLNLQSTNSLVEMDQALNALQKDRIEKIKPNLTQLEKSVTQRSSQQMQRLFRPYQSDRSSKPSMHLSTSIKEGDTTHKNTQEAELEELPDDSKRTLRNSLDVMKNSNTFKQRTSEEIWNSLDPEDRKRIENALRARGAAADIRPSPSDGMERMSVHGYEFLCNSKDESQVFIVHPATNGNGKFVVVGPELKASLVLVDHEDGSRKYKGRLSKGQQQAEASHQHR